ncbi:CRISPR-associated endoribonuclease Cas6 [Alistipes sp. ZOR0009]|jgi:CRISPR-associated endoribonuclease Cas6|uniref:CRISPR-associated endoribonuclease Cas6 n=1 Tax=Alistipes sp. ZOR0009 TaxID=1339253 RepID=UPI00064609A4|nr:CRISPR-associated endoribonuclease Cas6 [Alistipes sp. ZOR0009]
MRYRLRFKVDHDYGSILPLNYQLEVYRLIRDVLTDDQYLYQQWLKSNNIYKQEKLQIFNFSNLIVLERKIYGDRMLILSDTVELTLSFLFENNTDQLVWESFDRLNMTVGDKKSQIRLKVIAIEKQQCPTFTSCMQFIARSPIVLQNFESTRYVKFLAPSDEGYLENFTQSMLDKYNLFRGEPMESANIYTSIDFLTEPKSKLIEINNNQKELVKGYMYRFKINAPKELIEIGYKIGFGDKNHLGFGFCDILYSTEKKLQPTLEGSTKEETAVQNSIENKTLS